MSIPMHQINRPKSWYRDREPSVAILTNMPVAASGEFELNDKEVGRARRLIYSINKQGEFRYRTMRDGLYLQVWRIK